ncbi:D-3-phosphoglycerate dehydrogenase [gut metagenome]|uniref:D-3-phosphoglycerate dehydrogenase n=1 Tax=gut metagenome TaxID=749906 RepID=J9F9K2_9ZZZZ
MERRGIVALNSLLTMKVLIATEKPFAPVAVKGIQDILTEAGYEVALLEKYTEKADVLQAVADANALIIRSDKVDAEVIEAAPQLKIVVRAGAGYDNVDLEAATAHQVVVMNTPGQNSNAVAELVVGLLLYAIRNQFNGTAGTELKGKRIGLMAFGAVAQNLARIADGFGMTISGYSPTHRPQKIVDAGYKAYEDLHDFFANNDVVSLHIPSTPETRGSIGYDLISALPKNGILANSARQDVIDEEGLLKALAERPDLSYVTDLKLKEHEHAVEMLGERYIFTPKKMGAQTKEANINAGLAAARQIVDFLENGVNTFQVNK